MTTRAARVAFAITVALALARVALAIVEPAGARTHPDPEAYSGGIGYAILTALVLIAFGALGLIVVSRQPRNPVGWVLALIPLALGTLVVSDRVFWLVTLTTGDTTGVAAYAAWLASWAWIPAMVPAFTILPLLFPTGRALSPRWRVLLWTALAAGAATLLGTALVPGPLADFPAVVNPVAIDSPAIEIVGMVGFALLVPTALACIASLVIRFRRARGVERQQLKWVAAAAALLPVAFSVPGVSGRGGFVVLLCGLFVVAGAVAIAMLRYRLYDIDVVINRALVYGALSVTLAATYLVSVLLLQFLLSAVTADNAVAVAASTLAVAGLARPGRRRIQSAVDRRFYRQKYDAQRTLEGFAARLRVEVDLDAVGDDLRAAVAETMQPAHVSLWLREQEAR